MSHTEYLFGFTGRKTAMDKSELLELAENGNLISGIYNYCDRWCERCPFTSRCLVYATEKADIELEPGNHELCVRARDEAGHEQPLDGEWNVGGYGNNAVQRIVVNVS